MATAETNLEVGVPTDQPLICKDSEEIEIECFDSDNKKDKHEKKKTSDEENEGEEESKFMNTSHLPVVNQRSKGGGGLVSTGSVRNDRTNTPEYTMAKSQSEIQVCVTNSLSVSQTSKNSLMTFSSSGTFYDHPASKKKMDLRITPKRNQHCNGKADTTDFRKMEQGLLQLLEDFHSGKLEAFGQGCTFERMENVREQQEKLARLHFDLNAQQELCGQHTEDGIRMAKNNLLKLTANLQELSHSIEQLQSSSLAGE